MESALLRPSKLQLPPPERGEDFEDLCLDLYRGELGERAQKNGRSGQKQNGADIFAPDQGIGIQCKKRELNGKKITEEELLSEIEKAKKFKPPLKRFILAASCKRDAHIQEAARIVSAEHEEKNLFSVEVHSWDEIKALLDKYPKVYRKYYVGNYSPPKKESVAQLPSSFPPDLISSIQSESRHSELNRIRDLINGHQPETALRQLKSFKKENWPALNKKEKYRLLSLMGRAELAMGKGRESSRFFIQALQFNLEDENARSSCAMAYLIRGDIKNAKKQVAETLKLNPANKEAAFLNMQIMEREGAPLKQIAESLSDDLKGESKAAVILSRIAVKRQEYKEAGKWLRIFGESAKSIDEKERYAALSLKIISEREDIKMARRAPDELKPELEKIKAIYKEFFESSQYSELKNNSPGSFINYAIALELNEEEAQAAEIIKEGIKSFPQNRDLKIELSRLLSRKGDIEGNISELEAMNIKERLFKRLKPPAGKSGGRKIAEEEETKKLLHLNFILANLYFQDERRAKEGEELLRHIINSPFTDKHDKLEASICLIYGFIRREDFAAAAKEADSVFEGNRDNIRILVFKSRIEENKGNQDERRRFLKAACRLAEEQPRRRGGRAAGDGGKRSFSPSAAEESAGSYFRDILLLSEELYHAKMYGECEPFLEEITRQNLRHPKIFHLLSAYFENGKNQKAIALAEKLFEKFPENSYPACILFQIYHEELGDSAKALQYYESFIRQNPKNDIIKITLISAYIKSGQTAKAKDLLKHEFDLPRLPADYLSSLSISWRLAGNIKKAFETQYQCLKLHPGRPEPREVYAGLVTDFKKDSDKEFWRAPAAAGPGCYVKIKELQTGEEKEIIIEEGADKFTPDHPLSKALSGKKTNDIFDLSYKQWRVIEIKSKYAHKYHEIMRGFDMDFPSRKFVESIPVPASPSHADMENVLKKRLPDPKKQKEQWDRLIQSYKKGRVCIGSLSKITGKHPIEIMGFLIGNPESRFISAFPQEGDSAQALEILNKKSDMIIDLSALFWLHLIKMEKYLETGKFRLYVCQSTIDSLKVMIHARALHSKDGLLTSYLDEARNLRSHFAPAEEMQRDLRFLEKIKDWALEHCRLKPVSESLVMSRQRKREIERSIGKEFLDSLLASHNEKSAALLCEDGVLGLLSKSGELAASRVRLFDLIGYFESHAAVDKNQAIQLKADLVKHNQFYIPVDHKMLLFLLKEGNYSADSRGFQRGLYFLGPVSFLDGVIKTLAGFLVELFLDSSVLPYHKEIIAIEALDKAFSTRGESAEYLARRLFQLVQAKTAVLPVQEDQIQNSIKLWLNSRGIRV